jgi:hypothetical protein
MERTESAECQEVGPVCYTQVRTQFLVPEGRLKIAQQFTAGMIGKMGIV